MFIRRSSKKIDLFPLEDEGRCLGRGPAVSPMQGKDLTDSRFFALMIAKLVRRTVALHYGSAYCSPLFLLIYVHPMPSMHDITMQWGKKIVENGKQVITVLQNVFRLICKAHFI